MQIYTCDGTTLTPGVQLERRHDGDPDARPRFVRLGGKGPGSRPHYIAVRSAPADGVLRVAGVEYTGGHPPRPLLGQPPPGPTRSVLVCLRVPNQGGGGTTVSSPDQYSAPCPYQGRPAYEDRPYCDLCRTACPAGQHPRSGTYLCYGAPATVPGVTVLGQSYRPYQTPAGLRRISGTDYDETLLILDRNAAVRLQPHTGGYSAAHAGVLSWDGQELGLQHSFGWELAAA
ncbi:MAG: hypothetical protein M3Z04_07205 [Chloroflexota bacterium]|nr:hypothetical protein [Chloroflexota bacterium]